MTVDRIHLNELKILSINLYAVVVSMAYMLLTEKIGEQNICMLFLIMECIILILTLNFMRKRKKIEGIVFLSIFFTNVLIMIFSAYTVVFLAPLSMISSCIYKIRALRNAKIECESQRISLPQDILIVYHHDGEFFYQNGIRDSQLVYHQ